MAGKSLEGQVALITGAAKRMGRSIALRLAAEGAAIIINYATSKGDAEALVREIAASGPAGGGDAGGCVEARGCGEDVRSGREGIWAARYFGE